MTSPQHRTSLSSRERNRIHARRTRQRKKFQMEILRDRADSLKQEQIVLKQAINEKNTANILVGLFGQASASAQLQDDPLVEELLQRPPGEIPDSNSISELPRLILPGQHASTKVKVEAQQKMLSGSSSSIDADNSDDGIDYELLGKDRSKCTAKELDQIRRERNRMHAKRTRDRKRLFMDEMSEVCRKLADENDVLRAHLRSIDPDGIHSESTTHFMTNALLNQVHPLGKRCRISDETASLHSNAESCLKLAESVPPRLLDCGHDTMQLDMSLSSNVSFVPSPNGSNIAKVQNCDQIHNLLRAAVSFAEQEHATSSSLYASGSSSPNMVSVVDTQDLVSPLENDDHSSSLGGNNQQILNLSSNTYYGRHLENPSTQLGVSISIPAAMTLRCSSEGRAIVEC
jgi:hypothetical protein